MLAYVCVCVCVCVCVLHVCSGLCGWGKHYGTQKKREKFYFYFPLEIYIRICSEKTFHQLEQRERDRQQENKSTRNSNATILSVNSDLLTHTHTHTHTHTQRMLYHRLAVTHFYLFYCLFVCFSNRPQTAAALPN